MPIAQFFLDDPAVALRTPEVPAASWDDGANYGGSNCPGIGINFTTPATPVVGTPEQFTLLDQFGDARTPQVSQLIGGPGYTDIANYPSSGGEEGQQPKNVIRVADTENDPGDGTVGAPLGNAALPDLGGWVLAI